MNAIVHQNVKDFIHKNKTDALTDSFGNHFQQSHKVGNLANGI